MQMRRPELGGRLKLSGMERPSVTAQSQTVGAVLWFVGFRRVRLPGLLQDVDLMDEIPEFALQVDGLMESSDGDGGDCGLQLFPIHAPPPRLIRGAFSSPLRRRPHSLVLFGFLHFYDFTPSRSRPGSMDQIISAPLSKDLTPTTLSKTYTQLVHMKCILAKNDDITN